LQISVIMCDQQHGTACDDAKVTADVVLPQISDDDGQKDGDN